MKTNIIFTVQIEGWHRWPDAGKVNERFAYLANRHRHIFHIKCALGVYDQDREIEIIHAKNYLTQYLRAAFPNIIEQQGCNFGDKSCEQIATIVSEILIEKYGKRFCKVSVLEDNENGASVML